MVKYYPIIATVLLDSANLGHILRMVQERSAEGQSAMAYVLIIAALFFWEAFYRIRTPNERVAIWTARFGILFNTLVLGTVLYFRYGGG